MTQQTPYIGCKISLISRLDIRYEGILYTVDPNESTIALAKVRSFGTEDRPTANPMPGRDEVYEYIIFKATDIKDLIVCETPKPIAHHCNGLPYDPAIVTVSQGNTSPPHPLPPNVANVLTASHRLAPLVPPNTDRNLQHSGVSMAKQLPFADLTNVRNPFAHQPQMMPAPVNTSNVPGLPVNIAGTKNQISPPAQAQLPPHYKTLPLAGRQNQANGPMINYRGVQRGGYYAQGGQSQRMSQMRSAGDGIMTATKTTIKFESDYDFEKANEQFQATLNNISDKLKKTKVKDNAEKSEKAEYGSGDAQGGDEEGSVVSEKDESKQVEEVFYDKSSSFFDRISCESLEKQNGNKVRGDWRKLRQVNQETFGHSAVRSLAFRRGRSYYGRESAYRYDYNNGYYNYGAGQQRDGYFYRQNALNYRRGNFHRNAVAVANQ